MNQKDKIKIAVIGGGIAGSTISLYLGRLGLDVTLFEKNDSLISGPPICHLHAGGNLYREISDDACITLLKESIDLLKLYPNSIDYRPTVLVTPKSDSTDPNTLFKRLEVLQTEYNKLINIDIRNKVLCNTLDYFKPYSKDDIISLKSKPIVKEPKSFDDWMIPVAKNLDLDKLKFPIIMVQEYGLNIFRIGATVSIALKDTKNTKLLTNTIVTNIIEMKKDNIFTVSYKQNNTIKEENF